VYKKGKKESDMIDFAPKSYSKEGLLSFSQAAAAAANKGLKLKVVESLKQACDLPKAFN